MEIVYNLAQIEEVAQQLIKNLKTKTWLFYGGMGVGKTTLIKAIVKELGGHDKGSSPTFSIVNEYELKNDKMYHFDLYRIKNLEEAYNFGIEDYLDSKHYVFIEWPEQIESILTDAIDKINITAISQEQRKIVVKE